MRNFSTLRRALATAAMAAVAAAAIAAEPVKIDLWHYLSDEQVKPLKEIIAEFQARHPEIEVNPVFQGRPPELSQKLTSSFASTPANNPTVSLMYENWTSDYLNKDLIDPIENYLKGEDGLTDAEVADIVKTFRDGNTWNGKLITMPFNKSVYLTYVNMDALKAANITTAPQSLPELRDAVLATTKKEGNRTAMYGYGMQPFGEAFTTLFFASGGEFLTPDGKKAAFNSPAGLAVLNFIKELQFPEKHIYVNTDFMSQPFSNKQIAMYTYSSASLAYNEKLVRGKFQYSTNRIPGDPEKARYVMQGTNIGIFKNKSEAERKAGWKLIKFMTSPANSAKFSIRSGYMPIRYSTLEQPEMKEFLGKNVHYRVAATIVAENKGKAEPRLALWEGIRREVIDTMVDQVLSKGTDPKAALEAAEKKANEKLATYEGAR